MTTGQRRNGETAGVGEQVEHALARRVCLHPLAAVAHVEKQPGILLAAQIEAIFQAVLADIPVFNRLTEQPLGWAFGQVALLE